MIYEPREDSFLLADQVKILAKNKKVIDIGTGSGIQAKTALASGASSVIATDINEEALQLINKNYPKINTIKSNLFENIKENQKFDLIVFNPPYLPEDKREDPESKKATTGGKKGDEIIINFVKQAPSHLESKGSILLLISSLTPTTKIIKVLESNNLSYKIISNKKLFMEELYVWHIFKK